MAIAAFFKHERTGKRFKILRVFEKDGKKYVVLKGRQFDWEELYDKDLFLKRGYKLVQEEDEAEAA